LTWAKGFDINMASRDDVPWIISSFFRPFRPCDLNIYKGGGRKNRIMMAIS